LEYSIKQSLLLLLSDVGRSSSMILYTRVVLDYEPRPQKKKKKKHSHPRSRMERKWSHLGGWKFPLNLLWLKCDSDWLNWKWCLTSCFRLVVLNKRPSIVTESQPSQTPISPSSLDPATRSLSPEYWFTTPAPPHHLTT